MLPPVVMGCVVFPNKFGIIPIGVLSNDPITTFSGLPPNVPVDCAALLVLVPPLTLPPAVAPEFAFPKREAVGWLCCAFPKSDVWATG